MKKHILYKIYYGDQCVYLGRTNQPIADRLRGHFFQRPMHKTIDITKVTRIETCELTTEADMFLYEIYYINLLKPIFNKDDKSNSQLTIFMPDICFEEYKPPRMEKWIKQVTDAEEKYKQAKQNEREEKERKRHMRKTLTPGDYEKWLEQNGY